MEVIAFVGPAGTGKSHRVLYVAREHGVRYIIDDGLFIKSGRILCGRSAKEELSKIKAIKRALFEYEDHRNVVKERILREKPDKLMVVATSRRMAQRICKNLMIPLPSKYITIEEVSTRQEIEKARKERYKAGKHVIPVPRVEVLKGRFFGRLIGSIKLLWGGADSQYEKTIVRPPFSFYGSLVVSPKVVEQLVGRVVCRTIGITELREIDVDLVSDFMVSVSVSVVVDIKYSIRKVAIRLQDRIKKAVEYFTGLGVVRVDVNVEAVFLGGELGEAKPVAHNERRTMV